MFHLDIVGFHPPLKGALTEEVQLEAEGFLEPQESPPGCETIPTAPQVSA